MKGQIFDLDLDWTKTNRYQLELTATEGYKNMKFSKKTFTFVEKAKKKRLFWAQEVITYLLVTLAWVGLNCILSPLPRDPCFGAAKALLHHCSYITASHQIPPCSSTPSWARTTKLI